MKKEEMRVIPKKNYVILSIVIIVTLCLVYYFYMWFDAYNESKLNRPILNRYMDVINYNEMHDYIIENPDTIIYVSVLENEKIREFEKELKVVFKNSGINKEMLYLDLTNDINNQIVINDILSRYSFNSYSILDVPCVLVIENSEISSIFSIKDNEYDVNKMRLYVNNYRFDEEDIND